MNQISLNFSTLKDEYSLKQLEDLILKTENEISIDIPLDSIGKTQSHIDIAIDLLYSIYIGESISLFCNITSADMICQRELNSSYWLKISFHSIPGKSVSKILLKLSKEFDFENGPSEELRDAVDEFSGKIESGEVIPELAAIADDYMANYITGDLEYFYDGEIGDSYQCYPERMFGFWKCIQSYKIGIPFYSNNEEVLVIPHSRTDDRKGACNQNKIAYLLKEMWKSSEEIKFKAATFIQTNNLKFVYNNSGFLHFPSEYLVSNARYCAHVINSEKWKPVWRFDFTEIDDISEYFLSENGDILLLGDNYAEYLFFNLSKIPKETAEKALTIIGEAVEFLKPSNIEFDWSLISDEKFEELCYVILSQSEKYDWEKIQRMGHSRSRDGGRDLVVESRTYFRHIPVKKLIIQCKLIISKNSGSSLF